MNQALRPYVTVGIVLVGAGMIAVTPVGTTPPDVQVTRDVALTATGVDLNDINFTQAWTDAFDTAKDNFTTLQTASSDASDALSEALKNADFSTLDFKQLSDALTFLGGDQKDFIDKVSPNTLDSLHNVVFEVLTAPTNPLDPTSTTPLLPTDILPVVNFLASPLSGQLIGSLGPSIAPWVELINGIDAITADLNETTPDMTAALQELVNLPANMFNGFLNGATLNLDSLLPAISSAGLLPPGTEIDSLSLGVGGLLSTGDVSTGLTVGTGADAVHIGGSVFNSLGLGLDLSGTNLPISAVDSGPLAGSLGVDNIITQWLNGSLPAVGDDVSSGTTAAVDPGDLLGSVGIDPGDVGNIL